MVYTGADAVAFIVSDLETAISNLPSGGPGSGNSRANKAAAKYLLAKLLLNKHIYAGSAIDKADLSRVITKVDEITGEGNGLVAGYFDIFREAPDNETIWYVPTAVGNRIFNGQQQSQVEVGMDSVRWQSTMIFLKVMQITTVMTPIETLLMVKKREEVESLQEEHHLLVTLGQQITADLKTDLMWETDSY